MDTMTNRRPLHPRVTRTAGRITVVEVPAGGATHKRVAGQLDVSPRTVEYRLQAARSRLGLKSNSQLILHVATGAASDKRA